MKKTLLLALALIAVGCAAPIPRNLDELSRQGPQYLDPETLEPYSGPAFRMSEDDSTEIVLRVNLRDGRFHGDFEDFDPEQLEDGTQIRALRDLAAVAPYVSVDSSILGIYQTGTYRDGQREGSYEYFYSSGVLRGHGTYENGELHGPSESYYENGQLMGMRTTVLGVLHGPSESYRENGQLQSRGAWNMDEPCGGWIQDGETVTYDPCPPDLTDAN